MFAAAAAAEEDDADFLSPTGGARLATLFGKDQIITGTGNDFFQYTAPKQPKKGQPTIAAGSPTQKPPAPTPVTGVPSVFVATAVHAYRFTNGQYVKQGKYGAAVVGSHDTKEYRLLLYLNQQQQIAAARIHPGLVLTVQPNNYRTFYDDHRQNWSIMFESDKAAVDFSKQVCIAKYNSASSPDSVLYQDLTIGEGQGVEAGDSLEVAFTGWLFQNSGLGQIFDSNVNKDKLLRLKLGAGKIIKGWEEGMLGMRKGGRRFLLVPPTLAYGSQGVANCIPPESTLAFEVEVKRVRLVKDAGANGPGISSRESLVPSPGPNLESLSSDAAGLPPSPLPPKPGEPAVRVKSNSISEQLANPDVAKAKLISRMAKMGQPMLPFLAGTAPAQLDSSDSEIEDPNTLHRVAPPTASPPLKLAPPATLPHGPLSAAAGLQVPSSAIVPATLQPHPALPGTPQGFQPYGGVSYASPQGTAVASQLQPVGPMYPSPFQAGDIGAFLMTEARQQNTEVRLAIGKVADKMDQLAAKVDEFQKQNTSHAILPGISSVTMETSMIMSNIQRIIQENERLKQEIFEKSNRIEEQNEKISELIDRNQRYVEQSNLLMEQRNNSLQVTTEHTQARVLHAEQEKVKVAEELAAATAQISRLQLELTSHQKEEMGLRSQLNNALKEAERHGAQLTHLQAQLAELQESTQDTRNKFQLEKQSRRQMEAKVTGLEEELADLRVEKESLEKNLSERKKKALLERRQAEEEMDEIRKSCQEELDKFRQQLKKARPSTDQAASGQLSLMQTELEAQWEAKCEHLLSSAREQHACQFQEACEERDAQQQRVSQLEEKLSLLKASRSAEDKKLSALQEQLEHLEPVKEKYSALQSQLAAVKTRYEERIQELERHNCEPPSPAGSAEEVKKIMNGVFQSLRAQFELEETYTGRAVLGIVMNTIKTITLQLLERQREMGKSSRSSEEEEEEEEEEASGTAERQQGIPATLHEERNTCAPNEMSAPAPAPAPPSNCPEAELADSVSASPEGCLVPEVSQAQSLEIRDEQTSLATDQATRPLTVREVPQLPVGNEEEEEEEEGDTGAPAQTEANPQNETNLLEPAAHAAERTSTFSKPAADEMVTCSEVEEPLAAPEREGGGLPAGPGQSSNSSASHSSTTGKHDSARAEEGTESSPPMPVGSSLCEEKYDSSKAATRKPSARGGTVEEDEEEELSMKGRPPPTPLFGDDEDDDDDLDWLG